MILRYDRAVQTAQGQAIAGADVYFLTQPANTTARSSSLLRSPTGATGMALMNG